MFRGLHNNINVIKHSFLKRRGTFIFLSLLIFAGLFLRGWNLGEQSLWIDEGYSINAAHAVIEKGYPKLDSGGFYWNGTFSTYTIASSMKLFGFDAFNPWSARIPAVLFGTMLIVAVMWFTRRIFPREHLSWMLAATIMTFSTWAIAWSRQARGYAALTLFIFLAFYFLYRFSEKRHKGYLVWSILFTFLAIASHNLAAVFIPAYIAVTVSILFKKAFSSFISTIGFSLALALLSGVVGVKYMFHESYVSFLTQYPHLSIFFWGGLIGTVFAIFDPGRRDRLTFLVTPFIGGGIVLFFFTLREHHRYLFPLLPFAVCLSSYAIFRLGELILPSNCIRSATVFTIGVSILSTGLTLTPKSFYLLDFGSPQPDFKSAFLYIRDNLEPGDTIASAYPHMAKIYVGVKGYWLAMNMTKDPLDIERKTVNGKDYYIGADIVSDMSSFKTLLERHKGFVIFEGSVMPRPTDYFYEMTEKRKPVFVGDNESYPSGIWVFRM